MSASVGVFAALFIALYAAHEVGDHWIQTHGQAGAKGAPGWPGRLACARHVLALLVTKLVAITVTVGALDLRVSPYWVSLALAIDAVSHYWADRRSTLVALADWLNKTGLIPGKDAFVRLGKGEAAPCGTGAYALDQSWHVGWLWLTALVAAVGGS